MWQLHLKEGAEFPWDSAIYREWGQVPVLPPERCQMWQRRGSGSQLSGGSTFGWNPALSLCLEWKERLPSHVPVEWCFALCSDPLCLHFVLNHFLNFFFFFFTFFYAFTLLQSFSTYLYCGGSDNRAEFPVAMTSSSWRS